VNHPETIRSRILEDVSTLRFSQHNPIYVHIRNLEGRIITYMSLQSNVGSNDSFLNF